MTIISIHQPLWIPWFPYLEKMYQSDLFVFMTTCQFEKNSNINRQKIFDNWITKPIVSGEVPIVDKIYTDGQNLIEVNCAWIDAIRKTLNIKTPIKFDFPTLKKKTERIIEICEFYEADAYLAAEDAPHKYLDIELMRKKNIKFIPFKSEYRMGTIEMLVKHNIEGCMKILEHGKRELHKRLEREEQSESKQS